MEFEAPGHRERRHVLAAVGDGPRVGRSMDVEAGVRPCEHRLGDVFAQQLPAHEFAERSPAKASVRISIDWSICPILSSAIAS